LKGGMLMPQISLRKGSTLTFEEIKRIRESLWRRMKLIEEINKNSSDNDQHIYGEQKEMACKNEVAKRIISTRT